jgi:drug/metabolite transporter (DMT)-like permease
MPSFGPVTLPLALGILYLGLISTALAMYLWNRSLALLEAGLVSLLFFAQPVVGVSLSALLLGESPGPGFWIGSALIGAGLILAALPDRRANVASRTLS